MAISVMVRHVVGWSRASDRLTGLIETKNAFDSLNISWYHITEESGGQMPSRYPLRECAADCERPGTDAHPIFCFLNSIATTP